MMRWRRRSLKCTPTQHRPSAMFSAFYCYCTILFKLVMPSRRSLAARAAVPVLASLLSFHRYEKPQQIRKTMKPFCLSNSASACRCRSLKILVEARFSSRRSMPTISKMTNLLRFQHFLHRFGGSRVGWKYLCNTTTLDLCLPLEFIDICPAVSFGMTCLKYVKRQVLSKGYFFILLCWANSLPIFNVKV